MALSLVAAPSVEPVTLFEAKRQCKAPSDTSEDGLIVGLITAARERAEAVTGRQLISARWDLRFDDCQVDMGLWYAIQIPRPPLISVESVEYVDYAGTTQIWASSNYQVDAPKGPFATFGRLLPLPTATWPLPQPGRVNALTVHFTSGYGTAGATVPMSIRQAMLLMIGAWYNQREDMVTGGMESLPLGAQALLTPYKVFA